MRSLRGVNTVYRNFIHFIILTRHSLTIYGESLRQFSSSSNNFQLSKQTIGSLAHGMIADMRKANALNPETDIDMMDFVLERIIAPALALSETLDDVMKLKETVAPATSTASSDWVQRIDEKIGKN